MTRRRPCAHVLFDYAGTVIAVFTSRERALEHAEQSPELQDSGFRLVSARVNEPYTSSVDVDQRPDLFSGAILVDTLPTPLDEILPLGEWPDPISDDIFGVL